MEQQSQIREGMTIYSADMEKLGKVVRCDPTTFVIEKGFFFRRDYLARYEDVSRVDGDEAWLLVNAQEIENSGDGGDVETGAQRPEAMYTAPESRNQETSIPLVKEELVADKQVRQGEVRLRKQVVTEQQQVTVPVTREEVHVERVATNREAAAGEGSFDEGEMVVPVYEEEIEVRKRPVVREEVRIGKTTHEEQRTASGTVRREEIDVEPAAIRSTSGSDDDPDTRR